MTLEQAISALSVVEGQVPVFDGSVTVCVDGDVAEIVIDNSAACQALTVTMMRELGECVRFAIEHTDVRFVVLKSARHHFCAGGHLPQVRAGLIRADLGAMMSQAMTAITMALRDSDVVSVSLVDGAAIGGGAELAMCTDFRLFSKRGFLKFSQGTLGVAGGWGGVLYLCTVVGRNTALRIVLSSRRIESAEAMSLRIADKVCALDAQSVSDFLEELRAVKPQSSVALKQQVVAAVNHGDVDAQSDVFETVWGSAVHQRVMER